jgi:hypothetical protein
VPLLKTEMELAEASKKLAAFDAENKYVQTLVPNIAGQI